MKKFSSLSPAILGAAMEVSGDVTFTTDLGMQA